MKTDMISAVAAQDVAVKTVLRFAYDPATMIFAGCFVNMDPADKGFVETTAAGWEGAAWDGKQYVAAVATVTDAEIAADPLQADLPVDDVQIADVKVFRDAPDTSPLAAALINIVSILARELGLSEGATKALFDAVTTAGVK